MPQETLVIRTDLPPTAEDISAGYLHGDLATIQTFGAFDVSGDAPELVAATEYRAEQKLGFLAGELPNPVLNQSPKLETQLSRRQEACRQATSLILMQQVRQADLAPKTLEDAMVDDLLDLRTRELNFVEMARMIASGELQPEDRLVMAQMLKTAGRKIYGLPDRDKALSFLQVRVDRAGALHTSDDVEVRSIAEYVNARLAMPTDFEKVQPVTMDAETTAYYQGLFLEECQQDVEHAFAEIGQKDEYSPEDMKDIFNRYLAIRGYAEEGWRSVVVQGRTMCGLQHTEKLVEIGANRAASQRTNKRVLQSMLHELEIHVGRGVRGSKLGSGLAGSGLANYPFFEEPFAGTSEDIYVGTVEQTGEPATVNIAISAGFDGIERDFRDSFELAWRMTFAKTYKTHEDTGVQIAKARNAAYDSLVLVWRGMPTDVPGCVLTRNRLYENSSVVSYLYNDGRRLSRDAFNRLLQAKYDARHPLQAAYIDQFFES